MKKTLLLFVLLLTSLRGFAYNACIDGIYYNFSGTTATVTYQSYNNAYVSDYAGDVIIPASVTYNVILTASPASATMRSVTVVA